MCLCVEGGGKRMKEGDRNIEQTETIEGGSRWRKETFWWDLSGGEMTQMPLKGL